MPFKLLDALFIYYCSCKQILKSQNFIAIISFQDYSARQQRSFTCKHMIFFQKSVNILSFQGTRRLCTRKVNFFTCLLHLFQTIHDKLLLCQDIYKIKNISNRYFPSNSFQSGTHLFHLCTSRLKHSINYMRVILFLS